eukprot:CAMPEP_0196579506 /NCGR_PEP_ID=MMETSP1081-20130531/22042_1 /TAXON_ID=36882 /ORGANISM="Pyramimonas amylifera, Strain CCMP720" /LENGTH=271 /DNA_ID=CAMNT_0041899123 /DNA_START=162 /DNA_END=977 /DNA_ORIENTATION=+
MKKQETRDKNSGKDEIVLVSKGEKSHLWKGAVVVFSGLVNPERAQLRSMALEMGAKYRPEWCEEATVLVSAFKSTPKVKEVKAAGGSIVLKSFLTECFNQSAIVPIHTHLIHSGKREWKSGSLMQAPPTCHSPILIPFGHQRVISPKSILQNVQHTLHVQESCHFSSDNLEVPLSQESEVQNKSLCQENLESSKQHYVPSTTKKLYTKRTSAKKKLDGLERLEKRKRTLDSQFSNEDLSSSDEDLSSDDEATLSIIEHVAQRFRRKLNQTV